MLSPNPAVKFTYEDYRHTPEDQRYEFIGRRIDYGPRAQLRTPANCPPS